MPKFLCTNNSLESREQLFGTAPQVDHWFVIEYSSNWEKEAFEESNIPEKVKSTINDLLEFFSNSRLQLIRNESSGNENITFYYAHSTEFDPKLYKFSLDTYEDLLNIDLIALIESGDIQNFESNERIALVCTHGSYDTCCGKFGVPIYENLLEHNDITSWRTTHVGAHRFSANIVMLPEGIYYGRVNEDNFEELLKSHRSNNIYLDCYRGRSCFTQPSQVSDYFLRQQRNIFGIYDIEWEYEKDNDAYISVEFKVAEEGLVCRVSAIALNNAIKLQTSCSDDTLKSIHQFYFYSLVPYKPEDIESDTE